MNRLGNYYGFTADLRLWWVRSPKGHIVDFEIRANLNTEREAPAHRVQGKRKMRWRERIRDGLDT